MTKKVHENFIKSSNLIYISAALGLVNLFLTKGDIVSTRLISSAILTLLFVGGLGYIVRQGYAWIKYLLLVLMIFGLIGIVGLIITNLEKQPLITTVNIIQTILQTWATVLLFIIPKKKVEDISETIGE
jgi:hypothetical protein